MLDKIRNEDIREELGTMPVLEFIENRHLSWWRHLVRLNDKRPVRKIQTIRIKGKRGRGRPKDDWEDLVENAGKKRNLGEEATI